MSNFWLKIKFILDNKLKIQHCRWCKRNFIVRRKNHSYCNRNCLKAASHARVRSLVNGITCPNCGIKAFSKRGKVIIPRLYGN